MRFGRLSSYSVTPQLVRRWLRWMTRMRQKGDSDEWLGRGLARRRARELLPAQQGKLDAPCL